MADWDPFADPAEEASRAAPAVAAADGGDEGVAASDDAGLADAAEPCDDLPKDIYAALRPPQRRVGHEWTQDEFDALLDVLFSLPDADVKALQAAFKPVAAACADNGLLKWLLWRRVMPLLLENSGAGATARLNLFGLLVDHHLGFMRRASDFEMNEVAIEGAPEGATPDGTVIYLFGWGGGTLADMEDIAGLYREMYPGALIARLTCNMKESFGLRCECAAAIAAASKAWAAAPPGAAPRLLVHLFSNAGFMTWTEMLQSWEILSSRDQPDETLGRPLPPMSTVLRGVVLDSACDADITIGPCITSLVQSMASWVHAVAAACHDGTEEGKKAADLNGRKGISILLSSDSPVKVHLMRKPEKFLTRSSNVDARTVHRLEPPVSLQFIYSSDDTVIRREAVESYLAQVVARPSRRGFTLPRKLFFEKSKHCFHKVLHREEYWKCVKLFASSVLAS